MALNFQQLRAGSAVNHLAVVVSTKEELTTLNAQPSSACEGQPFTSDCVLNSIFTIFAFRPSSSLIQSPMSTRRRTAPVKT